MSVSSSTPDDNHICLSSLCYFVRVCLPQLTIFSACLSVCFSRWEVQERGGAYSQQGWPWQKSDDLKRAAISIIMEKLISWCIGLRVRLWGVEVVRGPFQAVIVRFGGGGVVDGDAHGWRMAGRREGRKGGCEGGLGWCGKGTISLAAVWCCSPCCHTSKREQIKGSSFDEYKTESPAEKHSPSLPPFLITEPQRRRAAPIPPAQHKMKGEQKQGEGDREHTRSQQRLLYNSNKHLSSRDICTEWWVRCGKMWEKMEWHQHIFTPHPSLKKRFSSYLYSKYGTCILPANKKQSSTLPHTEACCLACRVVIKYLIFPSRCTKTALPYGHKSN